MPTKVFTLLGGDCPFGRGIAIDSNGCRKCQHYYRAGTGTFFWCNHPIEQEPAKIARKSTEIVKEKRKRGRPPGKSTKPAKKTTKKVGTPKKAVLRPVKVIKQQIK